jgi:hypothetical protein
MAIFQPNCLPLLIGSLPISSHQEATDLIFRYTPDIPLWPQLPVYKREGMVQQFLPGFPGAIEVDDKVFIDTKNAGNEQEVLNFYEDYLGVTEDAVPPWPSRFGLSQEAAPGFYTFLEQARVRRGELVALKGQITGPFTFCTGLVDQSGRAIFYNDQLRDLAVKHLAMKARWQARKMAELCERTIIFFDEPALAGLGSSAFITITPEDIVACLSEVFAAVRIEKGLTGVHVCANTEWSVVFESGVDIVSYDAYSFFDKLILYPKHLLQFLAKGGILATGIIPTAPEFIEVETADSLVTKWFQQAEQLMAIGIDRGTVFAQSLITPSCGTGAVSREHAQRVLELTRSVSDIIRSSFS